MTIVVVGILVALQVNNWNQSRLDHARAESYYRRIDADLMVDRQHIDVTLKFWKKVSDYGSAAMVNGESGQRVDGSNWKTLLAWYQASQLMPFELVDTTFSEMRDDGSLALIDNEKLRKELADYYRLSGTGITANILRHDPAYRMQVRGLTPWRVQQYIWNKCFSEGAGAIAINQALIDCPSPISEEEAAEVLDSYGRSDTLLQNLRFWMSTPNISELILDKTRTVIDKLAADVEAARTQ